MIEKNYDLVLEKVEAACKRASRNIDEVLLIAVSKTNPAEAISTLYNHGVKAYGENKVQELCDKYEKLPKDIDWHMIGHLQRNKVKYIVDKVKLIHSVDSLRLAQQINDEAIKKNVISDILIEVNVANEESKFGLDTESVTELVMEVAKLPNVRIKGLMTIAPYVENPEDNRKFFRELKQLSVDIKDKNIDNVCMKELSMGMTNDYEVAIEEGATIVRVGTGIFGERDYSV